MPMPVMTPPRLAPASRASIFRCWTPRPETGHSAALIPIALSFDRCPLPGGYRGHAVAIGEERIPSLAACLDDVLVALPDPHAELIATQILPDVLDRVELGRVGR